MRMIVFFDLPTKTAVDLKEYRKFRKVLITNGFVMMQESVYTKVLLNQSVKNSVLEMLKKNKPPQGLVQALTVTEKQFAGTVNIVGRSVSNVVDSDERLIILGNWCATDLNRLSNGKKEKSVLWFWKIQMYSAGLYRIW